MADQKISQLAPLTEIDGTEIFPVAKGNGNNSVTSAIIKRYMTGDMEQSFTPGKGLEMTADRVLNVILDTDLFYMSQTLPDTPPENKENKILLIPVETTGANNEYSEYMWVVDDENPDGHWEQFGIYKSEVDLTPYLLKEDADQKYAQKSDLNNKVDKEEGKGLSSNDFTNEEKEKLSGLSNYDDTALRQHIADTYQEKGDYVTNAELEEKGYLTEHQDISGKQDKLDNSLKTSEKTVTGAINELYNGKQNAHDDSLATESKDIVTAINEVKSNTDANTDAIGDIHTILERINNAQS